MYKLVNYKLETMTIEEAYKTLGVEQNAEFVEIKKAYKKLCKQYHPDLNTGYQKIEEQIKINKAFEVIEYYYKLKKDIVPIHKEIQIFKEISNFQKAEERRKIAENEFQNFKNRKIINYRIIQTISWVFAALTLIISFFKDSNPSFYAEEIWRNSGLTDRFIYNTRLITNTIIIVLGYIGLLLQILIMIINNKVKRINSLLSNKNECLKYIFTYLIEAEEYCFSKAQLAQLITPKNIFMPKFNIVTEEKQSLIFTIIDFSELLIINSKQHGFIEEILNLNNNEDYKISTDVIIELKNFKEKNVKPIINIKLYQFLYLIILYLLMPAILFLVVCIILMTFTKYGLLLLLIPLLGLILILLKITKLIIMD